MEADARKEFLGDDCLSIIHRSYISPDGMSYVLQSDLKQAERKVAEEKRQFLELKILYDIMQDIINRPNSRPSEQARAALQRLLCAEESAQTVLFPPVMLDESLASTGEEPVTSVYGLSREDILQSSFKDERERTQCLDQVKRSILPEVEAQLQDRCALLMEYLGDDEESLTHSKRSENADPLYLAISQRVESVKQKEALLKQEREGLDERMWTYFNLLCQEVEVMIEVLQTYLLTKKPQAQQLEEEWLIQKTEAMVAKLRMLKYQITAATYTKDTLPALQVIKQHLDKQEQELSKEIEETNNSLARYETLDSEFDALVTEYNEIKAEIRKTQRSLKQMQSEISA